MRLTGKTALITGGTSGIGLATAELFLREGARVAITGRDPERLAQARARLGGDVVTIAADVRKAADLRDMARQLAAAFGATGLERRSSNWRARPPSSWRTPNARWRGRIPAGRMGAAHEIAEAVLFLASDASRYMLGAEVVVDGGFAQL